jgi:class 3 adenylate cyclase
VSFWVEAAIAAKGGHAPGAVNVKVNDRVDYFGSTVNIAARLPGFSQGGELIFRRRSGTTPK